MQLGERRFEGLDHGSDSRITFMIRQLLLLHGGAPLDVFGFSKRLGCSFRVESGAVQPSHRSRQHIPHVASWKTMVLVTVKKLPIVAHQARAIELDKSSSKAQRSVFSSLVGSSSTMMTASKRGARSNRFRSPPESNRTSDRARSGVKQKILKIAEHMHEFAAAIDTISPPAPGLRSGLFIELFAKLIEVRDLKIVTNRTCRLSRVLATAATTLLLQPLHFSRRGLSRMIMT